MENTEFLSIKNFEAGKLKNEIKVFNNFKKIMENRFNDLNRENVTCGQFVEYETFKKFLFDVIQKIASQREEKNSKTSFFGLISHKSNLLHVFKDSNLISKNNEVDLKNFKVGYQPKKLGRGLLPKAWIIITGLIKKIKSIDEDLSKSKKEDIENLKTVYSAYIQRKSQLEIFKEIWKGQYDKNLKSMKAYYDSLTEHLKESREDFEQSEMTEAKLDAWEKEELSGACCISTSMKNISKFFSKLKVQFNELIEKQDAWNTTNDKLTVRGGNFSDLEELTKKRESVKIILEKCEKKMAGALSVIDKKGDQFNCDYFLNVLDELCNNFKKLNEVLCGDLSHE